MIPDIKAILEMLITNQCTLDQALGRINTHMKNTDLRDHFAGLAMQAAATNPEVANAFTFGQRAEWAYLQADAMLAWRQA